MAITMSQAKVDSSAREDLLNSSVDERKKVLSDDRIKIKLINSDYKYDFVFLSQGDSDILVYLLNGKKYDVYLI